jgi:hypothetical protein
MCTHATSCIGETSLQNRQKTKESLGNIGIFLLLKPNFPHTKFDFLQRLSAFFNSCSIFLNGFSLSKKSKKIYIRQEVYKRSVFELRIFCHLLLELCNFRYNTQQTGLVYLTAIPRKTAVFAAAELEKYFGFVGYPHIFHTGMQNLELKNYLDLLCYSIIRFVIHCTIFDIDNGKEFITQLVVDLMKQNNLNCFIVTGCPRNPCDQGSVERAKKLVQRVMKSISFQHCLAGLEVNWTRFLGLVMAKCNSHSGRKKYCVSNYEAVFGQKCTANENNGK